MAVDYSDDAQLVEALRAGDEAAFAWLLDRYGPTMKRVARSYVASDAAADEVVQETWMAVITGIDRFEQRSSVKTWIMRILANIARTKGAREHRTVPFASLEAELADDTPAVAPDRFHGNRTGGWPDHWSRPPLPWDDEPAERLVSEETLETIAECIAELPPNQRAVVTLRDVEGWESHEVCNALDISETNQRVLLHRARSRIRQALERKLLGDP